MQPSQSIYSSIFYKQFSCYNLLNRFLSDHFISHLIKISDTRMRHYKKKISSIKLQRMHRNSVYIQIFNNWNSNYIYIYRRNMQIKEKKSIYVYAIVLLVIVCCGQSKQSQINEDYDYSLYKKQFKKEKIEKSDQYAKKQAFEKTLQVIKQNNEKNSSYQLEVNEFSDFTPQQMKKLCNYNPSNSSKKPKEMPKLLRSSTIDPAPIDYRTLGKVTEPKYQGLCGSCWAFASVGLYESLFLIHTQQEHDFSQQYTTSCTSDCYKCDGGFPVYALGLLQTQGLPEQSSLSYSLEQYPDYSVFYNNCSSSNLPKVKLPNNILNVHYYQNVDENFLKETLRAHGPIVVAVSAGFDLFYNYKSGIFEGCMNHAGDVDHAVLLVGFTEQGDWIIKNSWGTGWGQNGYMRISKNYNCKITRDISYMEVQFSSSTNFGENTQVVSDNSTSTNDTTNTNNTNTTNNSTTNNTNNTNSTSNTTNVAVGLSKFKVNLVDSYGDGWNQNVLAVYSGNQLITYIGDKFTSGASYGPTEFTFNNSQRIQIVVAQFAQWTEEIGFTITNITNGNNTVVVHREPGLAYSSDIIFYTYNPVTSKAQYFIKCFDTWGDGWNGNSFALKIQNSYMVFGKTFTTGHEYGPYKVEVQRGSSVDIVPYDNGDYKEEISFTIRDIDGNLIFEKTAATYQMSAKLGNFCAQCTNLNAFKAVNGGWKTGEVDPESGQTEVQQQKQKTIQPQNKQSKTDSTDVIPESKGSMTVIIILSSLLAIMTCISLFSLFFILKLYRNSKEVDMQQSAYDIHKNTLSQSQFPDKSRNDIGLQKSLKEGNGSD